MRQFVLTLLLFAALPAFSQPADKAGGKDDRRKLISDTQFVQLKAMRDSIQAARAAEELRIEQDRNIANLNAIVKQQKDRQTSQKRGAFIRIGIGLLLFVVLLIGLRRRRAQRDKAV